MTKLPILFLKSFPEGFFRQEPSELREYGRDWTRAHDPKPSAIAFPKSTEDVSKLLKLCLENRIAVVPSGGRTGLSGGAMATNGEIVLSLTKMNRIGEIDPLSRTVRVQAGAVTEAVHDHCAKNGLTWPVDFGSKGSSTVGGNLATNAGGVNVIRHGNTREWVAAIEAVLMDGSVLELNRGGLVKNNSGYDLRHLLIGSEGTLAVITEATLKLTPLPKKSSIYFFGLPDMASVLKLFREAQSQSLPLLAFECLSRKCLESVLTHRQRKDPFSGASPQYVLIEIEGEADENMETWMETLLSSHRVSDATMALSSKEAETLWELREGISESLAARGIVHKNDVSLPIARIEEFEQRFLGEVERNYKGFGIFIFGHIGDGNLHVNILKPQAMEKEAFFAKCKEVDQVLFQILHDLDGSVSAEHGIGLLKKQALPFTRSAREITILRAIKKAFDPEGLLNPGKIFDEDKSAS